MAARLLGAAMPAMTAAIIKTARPISIAVKRYKNLLLQKPHTNQKTNDNIKTADIDKLYTLPPRLIG